MIISNSDISSMQRCERRFYYERYLELRPKEYPEPMEVGTFGHYMMEDFFNAVLDGAEYEEACRAVTPRLNSAIAESTPLALAKTKVYRHVLAFGSYYFQQPWRAVATEESQTVPVAEDIEFGFTPDLRLEWTMGPKKGRQFLVDYKFTGQYWNDREVNMFQQLPKYIIYARKNGQEAVRDAALIMLNTRAADSATGNKLFIVKWIPITKQKLFTIERENEQLLQRAYDFYNLPPDQIAGQVMRTVNKDQCKLCFFADDLCPMDLEGRDTTRVMKYNYIKNDYGYGRDVIKPCENHGPDESCADCA